jgi:uncharacterized protein YjbI with pentapeptide repeats
MAVWMSIALVAVACIVVGAALCAIWWWVPKLQIRGLTFESDKDRAATEDNFRKTVSQVIGGAAVLVGAGLAYLQFSSQQQASHDLLISNQVSKGFEQFANKDSVTMRLGGIYALEGVMNAPNSQYRTPVLEALSAFVRDGTKDQTGDVKPATDIQAVLTVIGRRKEEPTRGTNLVGVNLVGANISHAMLPFANLDNAVLDNANLDNAILVGTSLSGAFLIGATLKGADLHGADLERANLTGAFLTDVRNLTQAQLDTACGKPVALPPGLSPPGRTECPK